MFTKKNVYKVLNQLHLWLGIILCVPLVLLGLTGSVLVFEHEINDMIAEKYDLAAGQARPVDEIIMAALDNAPDNSDISMVRLPEDENKPASISFNQKVEGSKRPNRVSLYVDTVSLEVLPESKSPLDSFFHFALDLHANLLVKDYNGRSIIGWLGIVMLILSVSGIYLWWPKKGKWKSAFKVKMKAIGLRFYRDLHKATGLWSLLIMLTVSFSGVYLAFPKQTGAVVLSLFSGEDIKSNIRNISVEPVRQTEGANIFEVIEIANNAVSDGRLSTIRFPRSDKSPYNISFIAPGYRESEPSITVLVDQWQKRVISVHDPRKFTMGETINMWQRAIHGGYGLHIIWKIIFFFSGFLPLLFVVTGIYLWLVKRQNKKAPRINGTIASVQST